MTTYSYESEKQARVRAEAKDLGWETPTKWGQRISKEVIGAVAPEQMHWRQKKMTSEDETVTTQWALKWHVKLLNRVLRLKLPVWCKFLKIMVLYWDQNKNRPERTSRWWHHSRHPGVVPPPAPTTSPWFCRQKAKTCLGGQHPAWQLCLPQAKMGEGVAGGGE